MDSVEYVKTNPLVGLDISSLPAPTKAPVIGNFRGVKQAQLEANQESDRVGGAQIEYQTATASVSRATQMLNSAKAEQTALQGQLQSAQAQLQSAQQERANAQTQAQAIQGQIAQAQADFTRRQEEARAQTEANAIADARERELVKSQIAKAQAEREVMRRQEEARAQAEMQEALKQKTAREQELARIQAEREAMGRQEEATAQAPIAPVAPPTAPPTAQAPTPTPTPTPAQQPVAKPQTYQQMLDERVVTPAFEQSQAYLAHLSGSNYSVLASHPDPRVASIAREILVAKQNNENAPSNDQYASNLALDNYVGAIQRGDRDLSSILGALGAAEFNKLQLKNPTQAQAPIAVQPSRDESTQWWIGKFLQNNFEDNPLTSPSEETQYFKNALAAVGGYDGLTPVEKERLVSPILYKNQLKPIKDLMKKYDGQIEAQKLAYTDLNKTFNDPTLRDAIVKYEAKQKEILDTKRKYNHWTLMSSADQAKVDRLSDEVFNIMHNEMSIRAARLVLDPKVQAEVKKEIALDLRNKINASIGLKPQLTPYIGQTQPTAPTPAQQPSVNQREWYDTSKKTLDDKYAWAKRLLNESTYSSPEKSEGGLVTSKPILGREADYERARQGIFAKERELNILNNTEPTAQAPTPDIQDQVRRLVGTVNVAGLTDPNKVVQQKESLRKLASLRPNAGIDKLLVDFERAEQALNTYMAIEYPKFGGRASESPEYQRISNQLVSARNDVATKLLGAARMAFDQS